MVILRCSCRYKGGFLLYYIKQTQMPYHQLTCTFKPSWNKQMDVISLLFSCGRKCCSSKASDWPVTVRGWSNAKIEWCLWPWIVSTALLTSIGSQKKMNVTIHFIFHYQFHSTIILSSHSYTLPIVATFRWLCDLTYEVKFFNFSEPLPYFIYVSSEKCLQSHKCNTSFLFGLD